MYRRQLFIIITVLCSMLFTTAAHAQLPQTATGLSYLSSAQNPDGTWGNGTSTVETTTATLAALETLKLLGQTAEAPYTSGTAWLQGQAPQTVATIADRIRILNLTDSSINTIIPLLDNLTRAWGGAGGYKTNPLDTALALQALRAANYPDLTVSNNALAYLSNSQNPDGGWSFAASDPSAGSGQADSSLFITAIVSATLQQFPQTVAIATTSLKATAYLAAHQNSDNGFGVTASGAPASTVFETALTAIALAGSGPGQSVSLQNAVNFLTSTQYPNGSWNDDPYATALAIKALYLSENKPPPPPAAATSGAVMGTVVAAANNLPLAGVTAVLGSNQLLTATTSATGQFALSGIPAGSQQITLTAAGYAPLTITAAISADTFINLGSIGLSTNPTSGTVMGIIWDADANAPYPGVTVQAVVNNNYSYSYQTISAADGSFRLSGVVPGSVTVGTPEGPKTGYWNVPMTGDLAPGGILIYNPRMSATHPPFGSLSIQPDKALYRKGDSVALAVNIRNNRSIGFPATLKLQVTDPVGTSVYDQSVAVNLLPKGLLTQNAGFILPANAQGGFYTALAELYDPSSGEKLAAVTTSFGLLMSQISVTPNLPAQLVKGANTVTFDLANKGSVAVTDGALAVTLKDPDGQMIATATKPFSLNQGERTTLSYSLTLPDLKFGTYTLSYTQSDETTNGQTVAMPLPNSIDLTATLDKPSYRIRETANLLTNLTNTGRFSLDIVTITVALPGGGYADTRPSAINQGTTSSQLNAILLPDTTTSGEHSGSITLTLPGGSAVTKAFTIVVPPSALALTLEQTAYSAGAEITPLIANSGGVDTQVAYRLSLYDAKSHMIAEQNGTGDIVAGGSVAAHLVIPAGATDGGYLLAVACKDLQTGIEKLEQLPLTITGVKAQLTLQTDRQTYLPTDSAKALSALANGPLQLQGGNLHLQVATTAANEKQKTWTTQADFRQGVRTGVDTFGVNDWLIVDDDFNYTAFDTNKWSYSGNVKLQSGKMVIDNSAAWSAAYPRWALTGDFDVQMDFSANNSVDYSGAVGNLYYQVNGKTKLYFFLANSRGYGYSSSCVIVDTGEWCGWATTGTYAQAGTFRYVRSGTTLSFHYWNGTSWVQVNSGNRAEFANDFRFEISASSPANASFDNIRLNSGRIVTNKEIVDAVRLLSMNDNFDDGVLNSDRWTLNTIGSATASEASGVITSKITQAGAPAAATASGRIPLEGDFDISLDWKMPVAPAAGEWSSILQISEGDPQAGTSGNALQLKRGYSSSAGHHYQTGHNNSTTWDSWSSPVTTSDTSGKFRIKRAGTSVTVWYWNNTLNRWEWNGSTAGYSWNSSWTAAAFLQFGLANSTADLPAAETAWNNFKTSNSATYAGTGTIRLKQDAGNSTTWKNVAWNSTQPVGTSIKFRSRTAADEAGLTTASWSDYLAASGATITSPPGRWIELEGVLATTNAAVTPLLNDLTVTYGNNPGDIIWQTDVPVELAQGALADLSSTVGAIGFAGKYYLQGVLTSSTGQTVAGAEYPFYVVPGNMIVSLSPDRKLYKPGETVTISGEVKSIATIEAANLNLTIRSKPAGGAEQTLSSATFTLPAGGSRPFSVTATAGADGVVTLTAALVQNTVTLASVADRYEVASPKVVALFTAVDSAADAPFTLTLSLVNSGKTAAQITIAKSFDSPLETVTIPAGETRLLQYQQQITAATTFTFTLSGDLSLQLTRTVAYTAAKPAKLTARSVTDKIAYQANEPVVITTVVTCLDPGSVGDSLAATVLIESSSGEVLLAERIPLASPYAGRVYTSSRQWHSALQPPGSYSVRLTVNAGDAQLATSAATFTILPSSVTAAGVAGSITPALNPVYRGIDQTLAFTLNNNGNEDLAGATVSIMVIDPITEAVVQTDSRVIALPRQGSFAGSVIVPTALLEERDYLAVLQIGLPAMAQAKTVAGAPVSVRIAPPPELVLSTLADGAITSNQILNITGSATGVVAINSVTINSADVPFTADGSFSQALLLHAGTNEIVITATDSLDHSVTDSRTVTLDQTAPALTITAPADNSKTGAALLDVTGTVDETSTVQIKLGSDTQTAAMTGTAFNASVTLVPGGNTVEITATDLAGNANTQKRSVIYDDQAPSLAITEPAQDIRTNQASLLLQGSVADAYTAVTVSIDVDGQTFAPEVIDGHFEQQLVLSAEKSYAIMVTATNEVLSSTTVQRNVIYDITRPPLSIDPVTSPTNQSSQIVSGTREADAPVVVTCATATVGSVIYPTATTWRVEVLNLLSGTNTLTATSTDAAGNTGLPVTATILVSGDNAVVPGGPAQLWIGLKNSDDQGTQFDLRAELYVNGVLSAAGETLCITGVTRNPALAKEIAVPVNSAANVTYTAGNILTVKLLTRIGTTATGLKCPGPGGSHSNAVGLRLYYDAPDRSSRISAAIGNEPLQDYYFHAVNGNLFIDSLLPTGAAKYQDSTGINFLNGNPWKEIGSWSRVLQ
jgi:prenyltransferase beta subunit